MLKKWVKKGRTFYPFFVFQPLFCHLIFFLLHYLIFYIAKNQKIYRNLVQIRNFRIEFQKKFQIKKTIFKPKMQVFDPQNMQIIIFVLQWRNASKC